MICLKKKKQKNKIHPYTEESLKAKGAQLNLLISIVELLLLIPILNSVLEYINVNNINLIMMLLIYIVLFLILYRLKISNKKFQFSKWSFLDDEVPIITDRKLDGEVKDVYITKHMLLIIANILIIIPISLTFSAILSSVITFIVSFIVKNIIIIKIIKFILIFIIFKSFFTPINNIFISYIKEKKELE